MPLNFTMKNPQTRPIRVMLVSDLPMSPGDWKSLCSAGPEIELAGSAAMAPKPPESSIETPINVIVVDLDGDIGIDAIAELCSISPARVLALTVSRDVSVHDGAILAGARGIVTRSEPVASLLKAIEKIDEGEFWIDGAATSRIFFHLAQRTGRSNTRRRINSGSPA